MIRRTGFISHASIFLSCMWQASKAASRLAMSWSSARTMCLGRCWGHQVLSHTSGMASTSVALSPSGSHTWNTSPKLLLISRGSYPKELKACLTPNSSLSWPQSPACCKWGDADTSVYEVQWDGWDNGNPLGAAAFEVLGMVPSCVLLGPSTGFQETLRHCSLSQQHARAATQAGEENRNISSRAGSSQAATMEPPGNWKIGRVGTYFYENYLQLDINWFRPRTGRQHQFENRYEAQLHKSRKLMHTHIYTSLPHKNIQEFTVCPSSLCWIHWLEGTKHVRELKEALCENSWVKERNLKVASLSWGEFMCYSQIRGFVWGPAVVPGLWVQRRHR